MYYNNITLILKKKHITRLEDFICLKELLALFKVILNTRFTTVPFHPLFWPFPLKFYVCVSLKWILNCRKLECTLALLYKLYSVHIIVHKFEIFYRLNSAFPYLLSAISGKKILIFLNPSLNRLGGGRRLTRPTLVFLP